MTKAAGRMGKPTRRRKVDLPGVLVDWRTLPGAAVPSLLAFYKLPRGDATVEEISHRVGDYTITYLMVGLHPQSATMGAEFKFSSVTPASILASWPRHRWRSKRWHRHRPTGHPIRRMPRWCRRRSRLPRPPECQEYRYGVLRISLVRHDPDGRPILNLQAEIALFDPGAAFDQMDELIQEAAEFLERPHILGRPPGSIKGRAWSRDEILEWWREAAETYAMDDKAPTLRDLADAMGLKKEETARLRVAAAGLNWPPE